MEKNNKGLIVLVVILSVIILGLVGYIAYDKINDLFERLNKYKFDPSDREQKEWFYSSIMRVGEPYLRGELMKLYNMHYPIRYND